MESGAGQVGLWMGLEVRQVKDRVATARPGALEELERQVPREERDEVELSLGGGQRGF